MPFCAGKESSEKKEDDTLDIINQRYSRGEISQKEYERIKNSLELLHQRYSSGEISRKEYEKLKQDAEYRRNSSF